MKKYVVTYSAPVSTEKAAQIQAGIAASLGVPASDVVVIFGAASFVVVEVADPPAPKPTVTVTTNIPTVPKE